MTCYLVGASLGVLFMIFLVVWMARRGVFRSAPAYVKIDSTRRCGPRAYSLEFGPDSTRFCTRDPDHQGPHRDFSGGTWEEPR